MPTKPAPLTLKALDARLTAVATRVDHLRQDYQLRFGNVYAAELDWLLPTFRARLRWLLTGRL